MVPRGAGDEPGGCVFGSQRLASNRPSQIRVSNKDKPDQHIRALEASGAVHYGGAGMVTEGYPAERNGRVSGAGLYLSRNHLGEWSSRRWWSVAGFGGAIRS